MEKTEDIKTLQNEKFFVEISVDETYKIDSADNYKYDIVMNPAEIAVGDDADMYNALHITVKGHSNAEFALVGSRYASPENCAILEDNILTVMQNDFITRIDLETMSIVACHEIEVNYFGVYYGIYRIPSGYLVYGEVLILKLDENFRVAWKFSGHDIFVSITGKNAFEITQDTIKLYDFYDNYYELDFDGNMICEIRAEQK